MITIVLVFISFLIWNIFNETLINISAIAANKKWHIYDSVFRVILFSIVTIDKFGFEWYSLQVILAALFTYHVLFDIGYNYKRAPLIKWPRNIDTLFHLGKNPLDQFIVKISKFIKFSETKTNIYFKIGELIISLILILWK